MLKVSKDCTNLNVASIAQLVDRNTAAICVSHVQYATGHQLDPIHLLELAHSQKALLVLDITQSAGLIPFDASLASFDVVLASAYKWLCGPFGAAFCYLNPNIWCNYDPPFAGWHSNENPFAFDATEFDLAKSARRMEYSTVAYSAGLGMAAAIDYLERIGIDSICGHSKNLCSILRKRLERLGGAVITPEEQTTGIVSVRFSNVSSQELVEYLRKNNIICSCRWDRIRFSIHLYNSELDVDRCVQVLVAFLKR